MKTMKELLLGENILQNFNKKLRSDKISSNFINGTISLSGKSGLLTIYYKKDDKEFAVDYNKNIEYFDNEKELMKFILKNKK